MLDSIKAKLIFGKLLSRPNIEKAYAMVGPEDSWYDTISTVHRSLNEIKKLPHSTLEIKSHDSLTLRGIYYPAKKNAKGTIICIHGYSSHAEREWAFPGLFYLSLGYNLLIPYQRAHGLSEGKNITFGALEHKDMLRWVDKINDISPDMPIFLHGLSMGGLIALILSDKEMKGVKGIISDAPSRSITSFFKGVSGEIFGKSGDAVAKCAISSFNKKHSINAHDYGAKEILKNCKYPLLLSAGENEKLDKIFDEYKAINPSKTDIIILPGCNHGNGMYKQTKLYQDTIFNFINENTDR